MLFFVPGLPLFRKNYHLVKNNCCSWHGDVRGDRDNERLPSLSWMRQQHRGLLHFGQDNYLKRAFGDQAVEALPDLVHCFSGNEDERLETLMRINSLRR